MLPSRLRLHSKSLASRGSFLKATMKGRRTGKERSSQQDRAECLIPRPSPTPNLSVLGRLCFIFLLGQSQHFFFFESRSEEVL